MKSLLIAVCLMIALASCDRGYPSHLTSAEQIQAVVLLHVTSVAMGGMTKTGENDLPLFFSAGSMQGADPAAAVLAHVARTFQSARPYTAAKDEGGKVLERKTGKSGVVIWIAPFSAADDGPITIEAGYRGSSSDTAAYRYRVQRVQGRWIILDHEMTMIA